MNYGWTEKIPFFPLGSSSCINKPLWFKFWGFPILTNDIFPKYSIRMDGWIHG
jgi:hypothetical protein